jgi:hypothetical protein
MNTSYHVIEMHIFFRTLNASFRNNGLVQKNITEFKLEFNITIAPAHILNQEKSGLST